MTRIGWVALLALAEVGCSSSFQIASKYVTSQVIPAVPGGTLIVTTEDSASLAGMSVRIPPGALAQDTAITVRTRTGSIIPAGATSLGPIVELGPDGTTFSSLVTVTLPYNKAEATNQAHIFVQVFEADGSTRRIEQASLQILPSDATLSFQVPGSSQFEAGLDGPCGHCPIGSTCDDVALQCFCNADGGC